MIHYVIPARKGSKGLPFKNRILFGHTAKLVLDEEVIVSTDDETIAGVARMNGFKILHRPENLANDTASVKDVLLDVVKKKRIPEDDIIVLLYLTYPERTNADIAKAIHFFLENKSKSLLCKFYDWTPYLMMYEKGDRGKQIIRHNRYRRQDYKKTFSISHYIGIFEVSELLKLNKNLYNKNTIFMEIEKPLDIDTPEDLKRFKNA